MSPFFIVIGFRLSLTINQDQIVSTFVSADNPSELKIVISKTDF